MSTDFSYMRPIKYTGAKTVKYARGSDGTVYSWTAGGTTWVPPDLGSALLVHDDIFELDDDALNGIQLLKNVINKSGGNYAAGTLVYISGFDATSGLPIISKADADSPASIATLVLATAIDDGDSGVAASQATVGSLNTSAASAVGSLVYLSGTAGGFTFTAPSGADQVTQVVGVVSAKHASAGEIYFFPGAPIKAAGTSFLQGSAVATAKVADLAITTAKVQGLQVINKSGGDYTAGQLVYISGFDASSGLPSVTAASNASPASIATLVLAADTANNATGYGMPVVTITGLNTSSASAVGSKAYLSTAGAFTFSAPTAADTVVQVVGVVTAKDASAGAILFFPGKAPISAAGTSALQAASVTLAKLAAIVAPSHVVKYAGKETWAGGGASHAATVNGVLASDIVVASISTVPSEAGYLVSAAPTENTITFVLSAANTTNDAVISYAVLRATS